MADTRIEQDSMGPVAIPTTMLWGASTQRAVDNFPASGVLMPIGLIRALARIKVAAARVNLQLGLLPSEAAALIITAGEEVVAGDLDRHFPLDCFQTGSGTSTNMNLNEVIANRAAQLAGRPLGHKQPVHPNDHVNAGQSSNDLFPSAIHLAAVIDIQERLIPACTLIHHRLVEQSQRMTAVIKIGRTHLQDATPVTLGQEFSGYAEQMARAILRAREASAILCELPIGGTAVGTGLNTHPRFAALVCQQLSDRIGVTLREASNHFECNGSRDSLVAAMSGLKVIAVSLSRIASDIRLLGSGPRCGLGELILPALQPGSSIMPGKVNPVICEAAMQVAVQVLANDACTGIAGLGGVGALLDLHVAMPVMARALLESITLLAGALDAMAEKCIAGILPDRERCQASVERSLAMVTALVPRLGYDTAAGIAKRASIEQRTIREVVRELGLLSPAELEHALDPAQMLSPGGAMPGPG